MRKLIILGLMSLVACSTAKKQTDNKQTTAAATPVVQKESKATPKSDDSVSSKVCESGKDKRTLEIKKSGSGCELSYEKFGSSKVVASSKNGTKHCEDSLEKITKKLEADKFKCE